VSRASGRRGDRSSLCAIVWDRPAQAPSPLLDLSLSEADDAFSLPVHKDDSVKNECETFGGAIQQLAQVRNNAKPEWRGRRTGGVLRRDVVAEAVSSLIIDDLDEECFERL
jgi:hypothetical protein